MARIPEIKQPKPLTVTNFLGLNLTKAGDTQLKNGESGNMTNCYITKDFDLAKIEGYLQLMATGGAKNIQGMWYGNLNGTYYFLFAFNGHVYRFNTNYWLDDTIWTTFAGATVDLGTLTDAPTTFFAFGDNVYILNGYEYKKWTGTGSISDVAGYIPKIYISCTPATGSGTTFEGVNLLTGKKRMTYNGDGTATYKLLETSIDSVDSVYVGGVLKTVTTHYTVNLTTGVITFTAGNLPAVGLDNVEIYYTKGTGTRDIVVKNRKAELFGEASDNRVFLYGHTTSINQRINSLLADGIPSAEYFTSANIDLIGTKDTPITDIKQQQDIILVYKTNETYFAYYDIVNLDELDVVSFPTFKINATRGNVALGQAQLLNNKIFTIDTTLIDWTPTQIEDERNMRELGARIQRDIDAVNLSTAITIDFQKRFEMWIAVGKKVWIYNYKLDVFSRLELEHEPTCFLMLDGDLFFGTTDGRIMKFSEDYITFNGTAIESHWEMNMYNFGADYLTKTLNKAWITLASQSNVSLDVTYVLDRDINVPTRTLTRQLITFGDVDFGDFSFSTNYNPKVFPIKTKAKKFTYLKLVLDNNSATTTFVVLNFTLQAEYGGDTK